MNAHQKRNKKADWLIAAGLIALVFVPIMAGVARLVQLIGGAEITLENARFFASPLPVVLHIVSVSLYSVLGALQFVPSFRHRRLNWHRAVGRLLVVCGLTAVLSGLWMTQFYPWPEGDGEILYGLRLVFGSAMLVSLLLGAFAIRQRKFMAHGDWMLRAYAIGLGAGTQVFTHVPWFLLFGVPNELTRAFLMGAGWVINLVVAEWIIRQRQTRPMRASSVSI